VKEACFREREAQLNMENEKHDRCWLWRLGAQVGEKVNFEEVMDFYQSFFPPLFAPMPTS
jgi:hypothetical protein